LKQSIELEPKNWNPNWQQVMLGSLPLMPRRAIYFNLGKRLTKLADWGSREVSRRLVKKETTEAIAYC
jgi:hypothetical protein